MNPIGEKAKDTGFHFLGSEKSQNLYKTLGKKILIHIHTFSCIETTSLRSLTFPNDFFKTKQIIFRIVINLGQVVTNVLKMCYYELLILRHIISDNYKNVILKNSSRKSHFDPIYSSIGLIKPY